MGLANTQGPGVASRIFAQTTATVHVGMRKFANVVVIMGIAIAKMQNFVLVTQIMVIAVAGTRFSAHAVTITETAVIHPVQQSNKELKQGTS